jgi:hypothetical protein
MPTSPGKSSAKRTQRVRTVRTARAAARAARTDEPRLTRETLHRLVNRLPDDAVSIGIACLSPIVTGRRPRIRPAEVERIARLASAAPDELEAGRIRWREWGRLLDRVIANEARRALRARHR